MQGCLWNFGQPLFGRSFATSRVHGLAPPIHFWRSWISPAVPSGSGSACEQDSVFSTLGLRRAVRARYASPPLQRYTLYSAVSRELRTMTR